MATLARRSFSPTSGNSTMTTTMPSSSPPRIVSKLAVEGKARTNGANVKLYLKLSIPVDAIVPGMPVALFQEDSLKIVDSAVQPLDQHNVPYAFSSSMLLQASRSLGLPNRSSKSYLTLFPHLDPERPLDDRLTGHISVIDYQVTYILPKELPIQLPSLDLGSPSATRASGLLDRGALHFMAAIEMVVPFHCAPPNAPYMLSIPIPRCLSNSVKFHIYPPSTARWDITTTPVVSPRAPSSPKSVTSSVSSLNSEVEDLVIQGSFPSSSRLVIRYALPDDSIEHQGRKKAGIREVSTLTQWRFVERRANSIRAKIACDVKMKGVWYAGVATLLGIDIFLNSGQENMQWAKSDALSWDIQGSLGYTGSGYTTPAEDTPIIKPTDSLGFSFRQMSRTVSTSSVGSGSSLLRAPLPQSSEVPDYSFENSSHSGSRSHTPTSSALIHDSSRMHEKDTRSALHQSSSPASPFVLHVNMSDLGASDSNTLECQIYGDVILEASADGRVTLPFFFIQGASSQHGDLLVQSDVDGLEWISDRAREPIVLKKTVSQRCPEGTIVVISRKPVQADAAPALASVVGASEVLGSSLVPEEDLSNNTVEGSILPRIHVTVTPLVSRDSPYCCAIRLQLPSQLPRTPLFEFGLASNNQIDPNSAIQVVSATVGTQVAPVEILPGLNTNTLFEGAENRGWICWIKVDLANQDIPALPAVGAVDVTYLIGWGEQSKRSISSSSILKLEPLLPCFASKIGCIEVVVDNPLGWDMQLDKTNLACQLEPFRSASYAVPAYFFPTLSLSLHAHRHKLVWRQWMFYCIFLTIGLTFSTVLKNGSQLFSNMPKQMNISENIPRSMTAGTTSYAHEPRLRHVQTTETMFHMSTPALADPTPTSSSPQQYVEGDGPSLRLRVHAVAALTTAYGYKFLNQETKWIYDGVRSGILSVWRIGIRLWHWPLPP